MKNKQPTSIRIDENLYNKVIKDAEKEKRSISSQIEYIIEKYYEIIELTKSS